MKKFIYGLLFSLMAVFTMSSCTAVDSSEVGIEFKKFSVTEQGKLEAVEVSGWNFYNPFTTSIYTYPVTVQRVDYDKFTVTTRDAAVFEMDPTLAYHLERSMAIQVFAKYRKPLEDIEKGYMKTAIYDAYRICGNKYTSDELMANRAKFEAEVRAMLDVSLGKEGFVVEEFTSQITPPASLREAIDAKNKAIQESLKAENEVKKAEANAKIDVAKAEGEAKALRIKADAEAYYNERIAKSLSPLIVQEDWIEKWNGELPQYNLGGGSNSMIMLPNK
jgi:regulator of protease activity HflC (stomatin/prohibitin superfamily)